jgi:hypothetical protein
MKAAELYEAFRYMDGYILTDISGRNDGGEK